MADEIDEPPANLRRLPVQFKKPPTEDGPAIRIASVFTDKGCNHEYYFTDGGDVFGQRIVNITYLIREGETEVECGHCKTKLDPMWVLKKMAHQESKWSETRAGYQEEMKRLRERRRTKCDHCGQMTRISDR